MKVKVLKKGIIQPSQKETAYREKSFKDVATVLESRLFCTCCLKDVKNEILIKNKVYIHPFFHVLMCKNCLKFYGDGYISPDEDGSDKYCRWCGQGGSLYICSECPVSICKLCIKRNMKRSVRNDVEKDDWKCFSCETEPLFELRALAWAVKQLLKSKKKSKKVSKESGPITDQDTLTGQLKNGLAYEMSSIKEIQKTCRSLDHKLGAISRRKELLDKKDLSFDKIDKVSKEVTGHLAASIEKLTEFRTNIESFFKELAPVIEKLESIKTKCKSDINIALEKDTNDVSEVNGSSKNMRTKSHSSGEESVKKRKQLKENPSETNRNASNGAKDSSDSDAVEMIESVINETETDSTSNSVSNKNCDASNSEQQFEIVSNTLDTENSKDTANNDSNQVISDDINDKQSGKTEVGQQSGDGEIIERPKITLRIRKVEEVNKALMEEGTKSSNVSSTDECEVIESNSTSDNVPVPNSNKIIENDATDSPLREQLPVSDGSDTAGAISMEQTENTKESSKQETSKTKESTYVKDRDVHKKRQAEKSSSINKTSKNDDNIKKDKKNTNNDPSKNKTENKKAALAKDSTENKKASLVEDSTENKKAALIEDSSKSESKSDNLIKPDPSKDEVMSNISEDMFSDGSVKVVTHVISSTTSLSSCDDSAKQAVKKKQVRKTKESRNSSKKEKNVINSDSDSDFEKLLNTKELEKTKKRSEICTERSIVSRKERKPKSDNKEQNRSIQKSILDYCGEDSDELYVSNNESDDSIGLLLDSDDEKKTKKNKKAKGKKDDDSSEEVKDSKTPKWKKDKLLTMQLSDSDSDDSTFKGRKADKSDKRSKKKLNVISDSDDDESKIRPKSMSESSNSDSSEEEVPKKKRRILKNASSSSDENAGDGSATKGHRKNIRKVLKKDSLQESTQSALKEEEERKRRIVERQKLYNQMLEDCEKLSSKVDKLVLDFDVETKEELLSVDKDLVSKLKPHQAEGIKFMWDSCFETIKKAKKNKGSGCILAHCMGLGKTLQVVTLVHTLLCNDNTGVKCALVLCPLSTVLNWVNEFEKWLSNIGSGEDVDVFHLSKVTVAHRASQLREWQRRGGVMILGYNLFRVLMNPAKKTKPAIKKTFLETLTDPGPDIVICDEGHLLKNEKTALSKSVEKIKTLRRIVLTGTPLQNNLNEYHCMMQFVKPNLLGTKKEFMNRFVSPIQNGQFVDSTPHDVKIMKRRAHVLHKMLDGLVQRRAYSVLVPFLPPKFEYVLSLGITDVQVKLYQCYLDRFSRNSGTGAGTSLFKDRSILSLICAHPRLLKIQNENELMKRDMEESDEEGSLKDFIDDTSESSTSSSSESSETSNSSKASVASQKKKSSRITRGNADEGKDVMMEEEAPAEEKDEHWWSSILNEDDMEDIGASTKLLLFFTILQKCDEIGDKLLLFSQSLLALDLIEYFLDRIDNECHSENPPPGLRGFNGSWCRGIDYFRLDGKTSSENRSSWCKQFNSEDNHRSRLFLISTRAGGLGINLTGANRVIIFDASWNPSHDVQSIFRIYRFGQSKPCYVYRFLNKGTMEQKVYDRQVTKLSMSCRVIDEQQIDRHFSFADLNELYTFTPNEKDGKTPPLPKDRLMAELLQDPKEMVLTYHSHDSLLENQENEELNEEERKAAWADFENEKKPPPQDMMGNYMEMYQKVFATLKDKYPTWSEQDLRTACNTLLSKMNDLNAQTAMMYQQQQQHFVQQQRMISQQNMLRQQHLQGAPQVFNNPSFSNQQFHRITAPQTSLTQRYQNPAGRIAGVNSLFGNLNNMQQQSNLIANPFSISKGLVPNPFHQNSKASIICKQDQPSTSTTLKPAEK